LPFNRTNIGLAALLFAISASPALATDMPACPATPQLPPEWAAWATPGPAPADGVLSPNTAYEITLAPVAEVDLTGFDGKELPEGSRGAVFKLAIPRDGIFRVTVANPMWIDLIGPDGVVESSAHGHGPDCSGLGKIVDFPLKQGTYRLEFSAAEVLTSAVMVLGPAG
jgi:hypothetical protein